MNNRLFCSQGQPPRPSKGQLIVVIGLLVWIFGFAPGAAAIDAPSWMRGLVNAPLPAHDEKTDAVLLYSDESLAVQSTDRVKIQVRKAYKILRPGGREYGLVGVPFNAHRKITHLHGWCIPVQGNAYEVKDKDTIEISLPKIAGSELISDVKLKAVQIPASDPGAIVGYEYEAEEQLLVLQGTWEFQEAIPASESHYSLSLPPAWEYKALFLNHPEIKANQIGGNQWQWSVSDVKAIRKEADMPPMAGVAGQMIVSFFPAGGSAANGFSNWQQMGNWYQNLTADRRTVSPEIKQTATSLTASANTPLGKMQALAQFMQSDIRYVAIELGIGGLQPHPASEVLAHRYGDCKDKATLMSTLLQGIGVDSFYVLINSERGAVTRDTPAHVGGFNHVILAVKLPDTVNDPSLIATTQDPKYGRLLFFDPTNQLTPFGQIGGYLQDNYGLVVTPQGGELVALPMQPLSTNGVQRTARLSLDASGTLKGDVQETRIGDRAVSERWAMRDITKDTDMIKTLEKSLAASLPSFQITSAKAINVRRNDQPFGFNYSLVVQNYAKNAGDLLLVRPRVMGNKASGFLETKEPREYAIEFSAPTRDSDTFEITLPTGYQVDEVPQAVDADYSFASYHSKTEAHGDVIRYTRTFEIRELSVPVSKADEVKKFNRIIASDERNMVVLKPAAK